MSAKYTVVFSSVAVTASQDLFEIVAPATAAVYSRHIAIAIH